jgi:hypothetical protein
MEDFVFYRQIARSTRKLVLAVAACVVLPAGAEAATWSPFVIRQASVQPATTPVFITGAPDGRAVTTQIDESGEKTGYGTSDFNGQALGTVTGVSYTRLDAGAPDPYVNIWVTDGANYAVIAPVANMTAGGGYTSNDVNGLPLQTLGFNIYETNFANLNWVFPGSTRQGQGLMKPDGNPVTLADIAGLTINDPGVYPNPPVGTGAPKNGTGLNLIFGDTQGNFASPMPYSLANVSAVPEPATLGVLALAGLALTGRRRRSVA